MVQRRTLESEDGYIDPRGRFLSFVRLGRFAFAKCDIQSQFALATPVQTLTFGSLDIQPGHRCPSFSPRSKPLWPVSNQHQKSANVENRCSRFGHAEGLRDRPCISVIAIAGLDFVKLRKAIDWSVTIGVLEASTASYCFDFFL